MGAWDFVIGILVGILLACVSFVVQSSQKSAVRASYSGVEARSLVRRHPIHQRYLREAGRQIHVTKLAGYMFFGTIVSVENRIRALLEEDALQERPVRYLIIDLWHVTGIDFSAAEAFTRINRVCTVKNVKMIMCGVTQDGETGKGLRSVGLWGGDKDEVQFFEDLNSALEYCENELLKVFYSHRDALAQRNAQASAQYLGSSLPPHCLLTYMLIYVDVPKQNTPSFTYDTTFSSPRKTLLHQAAADTLTERDPTLAPKWHNFKQPLPLILQSFQELTAKNEDFWFKACSFFVRKEHLSGSILFRRGVRALLHPRKLP
jgi:sulfate permease, SulP family